MNAGEEPGVLIRLANKADLSPALIARQILELHFEKTAVEGETPGRYRLLDCWDGHLSFLFVKILRFCFKYFALL